DNRKWLTLELTALRLIDSSGVGVIVSLFKRIRANGGQVKIVGLRDQPRAIFRLLRLDRVLPVQGAPAGASISLGRLRGRAPTGTSAYGDREGDPERRA